MRQSRFIFLFLAIVVFLVPISGANAQEREIPLPQPRSGLPSIDPGNLELPGPFGDFINSAKQINQDVQAQKSRLEGIRPGDLFRRFGEWFRNLTGIDFLDALKGIGNLFAWFFSLLASLIRWIVSLI
ncbi:hypothetical protein C4571_00065 [Candidatus Parcubacteria bacterium]|nr:MAG: hypothetical protein C4571_00065 [Candidatus Parcubacteria bacterium]